MAAFMTIAGDVNMARVRAALEPLQQTWKGDPVAEPEFVLPAPVSAPELVFVDVPGAKQSVINIGCLGLTRTDPDYFPATVMNHKLGGSFNSNVNLVLREEKGYTYGARTGFGGSSFLPGTFTAGASVRSSATLESVQIFKDLMERYPTELSEEDLLFTKNSLTKSFARQFETLGAKQGMLSDIGAYNLPVNYVTEQQKVIHEMTLDRMRELARKYINTNKMYFVVAGDAASQKEGLEKLLVK